MIYQFWSKFLQKLKFFIWDKRHLSFITGKLLKVYFWWLTFKKCDLTSPSGLTSFFFLKIFKNFWRVIKMPRIGLLWIRLVNLKQLLKSLSRRVLVQECFSKLVRNFLPNHEHFLIRASFFRDIGNFTKNPEIKIPKFRKISNPGD